MEENKNGVEFDEDKTIVIDEDELKELEESIIVENDMDQSAGEEEVWRHADSDDLSEMIQKDENKEAIGHKQNKNKKKVFIIVLVVFIVLLVSVILYFFLKGNKKKETEPAPSVFNDIKVRYIVESDKEPNGEWYVEDFDIVLEPEDHVKEYYYCVADSNNCDPNIKIKGSKKTTITINQNGMIHKVCSKTMNDSGIMSKVNCSPVYRMDKDQPMIIVGQEDLKVFVGQNKKVKDYFTIEESVSKIQKVSYMVNDKEIENLNELQSGTYKIVCQVRKENGLEASAEVFVEIIDEEVSLSQVVRVGDYVAYDAGKWSNSATVPKKSAEFGGYKSNTSKSQSVTCSSGDNSTSYGFRVLKVEGDTVTLIHAGVSECYYHEGSSEEALTHISARIYGQYYNSQYAQSARGVICSDFSSYGIDDDCSDGVVGDQMVNVGSAYWIGSTADEEKLSFINNYGKTGLDEKRALGIRPVIVLRSDLKVVGGDGSSVEKAYQIEKK